MDDIWPWMINGATALLWLAWQCSRTKRHRDWRWTRQPADASQPRPQEEILPALAYVDRASKRLAMYVYNGTDVMAAIEYARRQLDLAERAILCVDPDKRPAAPEQDFM